MSKFATKAIDNVFCRARYEAAKINDRLRSRDGAAEELGMDKSRLARIELGSLNPYPEEVLLMADTYRAPELGNYFCSSVCPLGKNHVPACEVLQIDRLTVKILASLREANAIRGTMLDIVADGKVSSEEVPKLKEVMDDLDRIVQAAEEMRIWISKYII